MEMLSGKPTTPLHIKKMFYSSRGKKKRKEKSETKGRKRKSKKYFSDDDDDLDAGDLDDEDM